MLLLMAALGVPAFAQQPERLDLPTALERAQRDNLQLAAARARRAVALAGIRIAGQIPNPTVTFGASRDIPHQTLRLEQPLEIGLQRGRRIDLAREERALIEVEISAAEREVRRAARESFFRLALAQANSELQDGIVKLAQHLRQIAQDRFEAGDVAQLEVMQAEVEVFRALAVFQVAQQEERVAASQFNVLLNQPAGKSWLLTGWLERLPQTLPVSDLVEQAAAANAALQHLSQEQRIEERRRALLRAQRIPTLGVQIGGDFNAQPDFQTGLAGQVSATVPLVSRNPGEIAQSLATQQALDLALAAERRSVAGEVEAAWLEVAARRTQVDVYREQVVPSARRVAAMAEESYRAGRSNILTVLDAQRRVSDTEHDYLQSLFGLQAAFAALEQVVGTPLD
ncbi:MAG: TolC family protein [Terriglobales bacterium]